MKFKIIFFFCFIFYILNGQSYRSSHQLEWNDVRSAEKLERQRLPEFKNAVQSTGLQSFPFYKTEMLLPGPGSISVRLKISKEHSLEMNDPSSIPSEIAHDYVVRSQVVNDRNRYSAVIEIIPFKKDPTTRQLLCMDEFDVITDFTPEASPIPIPDFTKVSALTNGLWYKISIPKRGIYKIDRTFIQKYLNLDPAGVDPRNIKIYGNGGEMLPESNDDPFTDDLVENPIYFKGEADGRFDEQDFLLFYANGPDSYRFNEVSKDYAYRKNIYNNLSYYFIKIDNSPGKRIATLASEPNPDYTSRQSFDFIHYEKDLVNLLDLDPGGEGSGKDWYGEELSNTREFDFGNAFLFENIDLGKKGKFSYAFAGRSPIVSQVVSEVESARSVANINYVVYSSISRFANIATQTEDFQPVSDLVKARISYPQVSSTSTEGWLDYFQISVWKKLIWNNKTLYIMDPASNTANVSRFILSKVTSTKQVWDITNPLDVQFIQGELLPGEEFRFSAKTSGSYRQFLVVDELLSFPSPDFISTVGNQNIHRLDEEDMLIIYNSKFKAEAERLMEHRSKHSGLRVTALDQQQVFNEFSSGSQDPTAIRNLARMLYMRNPNFKYLLLFGDGSYDQRYINTKDPNQNFIVSYETDESLDPILAFPSDDYFGLLDPGEGKNLAGKLDINIGRLGARDSAEAKNLVDKIIRYDTDPRMMGDWKLSTLYSADDEDSNIHFTQAERIAETAKDNYPLYNQEKIYLDAYEQITTPGGERYPEVNKAFANAFYQGALVVNYLGHGGYTGLAQERILQNTDIRNLENYYKLPLVIVASCTFNGYDDPSKTNAGEEGLHNRKGGFLALFSTVRAVYSDDNFDLTNSVYSYLFQFENGQALPLGEIMRRSKNEHSSGFIVYNSRKFLLFGDPSQRLAIPTLKNKVTKINSKNIGTQIDTFRALENVHIEGIVTDQNDAIQSGFNGKLYITVYDKEISLRTKANDPGSFSASYPLQKNIIYKGLVEVLQGAWEFNFTIPKDINYDFGQGKISLYATDEKRLDAAGFEQRFIIGGVSKDSLRDDTPPLVNVFINDAYFRSGGICDANPKIYAELSDDTGINISGNSIGHDLIAVLDGNTQSPIILNQSYQSKFNNQKEGVVNYPLKNLKPGKHTLEITAWDIANNSGTGQVEFFVVTEEQLLQGISNYPNPFSDKTVFQFETNLSAIEMHVRIDIQSLTGSPVRVLEENLNNPGYRVAQIEWDGMDQNGGQLPNGMYLYKLTVSAKTGQETIEKASDYQKLVLVK